MNKKTVNKEINALQIGKQTLRSVKTMKMEASQI